MVLRRKVGLAGRFGRDLPALGCVRREFGGVGVAGSRLRLGSGALAVSTSNRSRSASRHLVLRSDPGTSARIRGLRVHAVCVRGRSVPVPGRYRRDRGRSWCRGPWCRQRAGQVPHRFAVCSGDHPSPARGADLAPRGNLSRSGHLLQPHRVP